MEHIQVNDIYEATIRCDEGFEQSISKIQDGKFALRHFQQRFWAWATNAGALAEPCLSLDARLLDHEKPKHMILTLLGLIQDSLQAALDFSINSSSEGAWRPPETEEVPYYTHSIDIGTPGLEAAIQRLNLVSSLIDYSSRKGRQKRFEATIRNASTNSNLSFIVDASRDEVVMKLARSVLHRKQRIAYARYRKQARQTTRLQGSKAQTEGSALLTTTSVGDEARPQLEPSLNSKLSLQAKPAPSEWLRPSTSDGESFARG
ncbi:hypothetical protein BDP67DRAFT_528774 [Colletotrichum lupini]|nr:hypothetical protein BDP67DRAFT_528774 [Colletotrichum lupini]